MSRASRQQAANLRLRQAATAGQVQAAAGAKGQQSLSDLGTAMDERTARLGESAAAEFKTARALAAVGPVPNGPAGRVEWQDRGSRIAACRELYGWTRDSAPAGPEPAEDSPEKRAAWHAARGAMSGTGAGNREREDLDGAVQAGRAQWARATECGRPHSGRGMTEHGARLDREGGR